MSNSLMDKNKVLVGKLIEELSADEDVQKLLAFSLGRVLLNAARAENSLVDTSIDPSHDHIRDWLVAAVANRESWLVDVDAHGRPRKLMKFGSLEGIVKEADKAMHKFSQKVHAIRLAKGDESLEAELGDGWYVVRLLTATALDHESGQMQHCIGQGGYDAKLKDPMYAYYSLRDPLRKAHATMEVHAPGGLLLQLRGKQNCMPIPEYMDRMIYFMKAKDIKPVQLSSDSRWVFDDQGNMHDVHDLPDGVVLVGKVTISSKRVSLPQNMTVNGELAIVKTEIDAMPANLTVYGKLSIKDSTINKPASRVYGGAGISIHRTNCPELAESIRVMGDVTMSQCNIRHLPLEIAGSSRLFLRECDEIHSLEGIKAVDCLSLNKMNGITKLPDGMELGSLEIVEMTFPDYPTNVKIKYSVDIIESGLKSLPEDLVIRGSLDVSGNPLTHLPKGLMVEHSLNIRSTKIERFPSDLYVGRSIFAANTPLKSIDDIKEVSGDLDIAVTKVTSIPNGLKVTGALIADKSSLLGIGNAVSIGEDLLISMTSVTEIPDDLAVGGKFKASGTPLNALPSDFKSNGELMIDGTKIKALPENLHVRGDLNISRTQIEWFPHGVIIEGDLICDEATRLREVPDDTVVKGDIRHPLGSKLIPHPLNNAPLEPRII